MSPRLPQKWVKWMRLLRGIATRVVRLQEVDEIANDLLVISTTSGSSEAIRWKALISPSLNASKVLYPVDS